MCLSIYLSVCLSVYLFVCLFVYLSIALSIYPSVLPTFVSLYLSICLSVHTICLSVCLSVCLSIYLSIHLSSSFSLYLCLLLLTAENRSFWCWKLEKQNVTENFGITLPIRCSFFCLHVFKTLCLPRKSASRKMISKNDDCSNTKMWPFSGNQRLWAPTCCGGHAKCTMTKLLQVCHTCKRFL